MEVSGEGFSWDKKMELEDVVEAISNMTTDESNCTKSFWDTHIAYSFLGIE